ncbi:hypothetical protein MLD38_003550 [Melastoma candidum]|uniref:Uncharacterized protein n=1 Tax=Melastoma candidum TaxID=119954 RepID=A0ACB9S642_9MYRT|nr:hypothetical protein MLD38_003550 [Melastoma candidum]
MVRKEDETRRGPWTEQEDFQLMCSVGLFGDRRWDCIAKVSGLNRSGKSCRLRWVNYLHPDLKREKMTPQEEKLVIDLQKKWGNRWSRIARRLPGRTDNEIKNYWRSYTRKQAQERKRSMSPLPPSSKDSSPPLSTITTDSGTSSESGKESFFDTGGHPASLAMEKTNDEEEQSEKAYSMDDIWDEIAFAESGAITPIYDGLSERCGDFAFPLVDSPALLYADSLWQVGKEESKLLFPLSDHLFSCDEITGAYTADYS